MSNIGLTVSALHRRGHRINTFINKIETKDMFTVIKSKQSEYGQQVLIKQLKYKDKLYTTSSQIRDLINNGKGKSIIAVTHDNKELKTSYIAKTPEFCGGKSSINRGYVGELLFSVAHLVLLIHGHVTVELLQDYIMDIAWDCERVSEKYSTINDITFIYRYPHSIITATQDMIINGTFKESLSGIVSATLDYINNSEKPQKLKEKVSLKGGYKITIIGDGVTTNKLVKHDFEITANKGRSKLGYKVSLKCGAVAQFSQIGGNHYDSMNRLFSPFVDVPYFENNTVMNTYKYVHEKIRLNNTPSFAKIMVKYIIDHMTSGVDMDIVRLNGNAYVYDFEKLSKFVEDNISTFRCEYVEVTDVNFKLVFIIKNQPLFIIRYRVDGNIRRNALECRNLLNSIIV